MAIELSRKMIPLGDLLHEYQLGLVLIAGSNSDVPSAPVRWVHVSELEDPTPFLPPATALLTTGARFNAIRRQVDADIYIQRLIDAEVTALGVAVGLHWDRVPPRIVSACDRLGLPLFRVPYDTAFIEIVQTAARLLEAQGRERDLWSIASQRAVANASLYEDGLGAALREAAHRLGRWLCVTDRSGRIVEFAPEASRAEASTELIRREARRLVERGVSAGRIGSETGGLQMQTLGRQSQVLGVLISEESGAPDTAERNLLGLVAALATVQLEYRAGIDDAQLSLREAIVELLIAQSIPLAQTLAKSAHVQLPEGSITIVRLPHLEEVPADLLDDLQSLDAGTAGLFRAAHQGDPIIVTEARYTSAIRRLLASHHTPAGFSSAASISGVAELIDQATRAFDYAIAVEAEEAITYTPALHGGILHLLDDHPRAWKQARSLLAPLRRHDRTHSDELQKSLRTWLLHHGQTSAAATALGVHRHTLTARVRTAAELLNVDLDSPDTRAEIWAAIRLLEK